MKNNRKKRITGILLLVIVCIYQQSCNHRADPIALGGGYLYDAQGKFIIPPFHTKGIRAKVIKCFYNADYVIAEQQPDMDDYRWEVGQALIDSGINAGSNNGRQNKNIADSILQHDPYYQKIFSHPVNYWIIVTGDKKQYGPYTPEELAQKRTELRVPADADLKAVQ